VRRRAPDSSLLHHSDRGCQYTSEEYREVLAGLRIEVSMSRKGSCWDNAVAESFFSTIRIRLTTSVSYARAERGDAKKRDAGARIWGVPRVSTARQSEKHFEGQKASGTHRRSSKILGVE
jgi:transposase InsO family protein